MDYVAPESTSPYDHIGVSSTSAGKPITWYVDKQVTEGKWIEETVPAETAGLTRPLTILRAPRKTNLITYQRHGDRATFCPPMWWDLAIGSGACGLGCRACFLILTHRVMRDPWRHLLYSNVDDFVRATEAWLLHPKRRHQHTLGVGIDRSDSLLYEGVTGLVRLLAPLFGGKSNLRDCRLILSTKSTNTNYLMDILTSDRKSVVVTFSLNPEPIADLWEGKWPDGERITRNINDRLEAAALAQDLGFEIRVRVDPILTAPGWQDHYREFIGQVRRTGLHFHYWTLGTYREKSPQLQAWSQRWGLAPMEWQPSVDEMIHDGTHWHLPFRQRRETYSFMFDLIRQTFPDARIGLCKETHTMRKLLTLCNADCNCLA